MLRLVKIGAEGEGPCTDIMEIRRPDDLVDIANLGLIPIGLFADLIDGLGDPRIAREGGETPGFVT